MNLSTCHGSEIHFIELWYFLSLQSSLINLTFNFLNLKQLTFPYFKERYTHLNALFQRIARRDKKAFLTDQCKETEENKWERLEISSRKLFGAPVQILLIVCNNIISVLN